MTYPSALKVVSLQAIFMLYFLLSIVGFWEFFVSVSPSGIVLACNKHGYFPKSICDSIGTHHWPAGDNTIFLTQI